MRSYHIIFLGKHNGRDVYTSILTAAETPDRGWNNLVEKGMEYFGENKFFLISYSLINKEFRA